MLWREWSSDLHFVAPRIVKKIQSVIIYCSFNTNKIAERWKQRYHRAFTSSIKKTEFGWFDEMQFLVNIFGTCQFRKVAK